MRKAKKIFSVLLAAVLVCGLIGANAVFAQDSTPTFEIGSFEAECGETIDVPILVKNNPGVAAIKIKVAYDTERLELTEITYGSDWSGSFQQPQKLTSPVPLTWYNGAEDYAVKESTFATLTFLVLKDSCEDSKISISYDPNNVYNIAEKNVTFAVVNGKIKGVPPVQQAHMSGDTMCVQLAEGIDAEAVVLYAAVYGANGQQKGLYPIDPTETQAEIAIKKADTDTVSIFALRKDTMAPLMPKLLYDASVHETDFIFGK